MKITEIELKNLFSHQDTKLTFPEDKNLFKFSGSNGSGKSSVISSMIYGLIKDTNKKITNDQMIRKPFDSGEVNIVVSEGNDKIKIVRNIGKKTTSELFVNDEQIKFQKQTDLNDFISDKFGIEQTFQETHQFSSEITERFMYLPPTQKLQFLEKSLDLTKIISVYKLINKKLSIESKELERIVILLGEKQKQIKDLEQILKNNIEEKINIYSENIISLESKELDCKLSIEKVKEEYNLLIKQYNEEVEVIKKKSSELSEKIYLENESKKQLEEVLKDIQEEIKKNVSETASIDAKIKFALEQNNEIKALVQKGKCPKCKRVITNDDISNYKNEENALMLKVKELEDSKSQLFKDLKDLEEQFNSLNSTLKQIREKISSLELEKKTISNELIPAMNNINNKKRDFDRLTSELQNISKELLNKKETIEKLKITLNNTDQDEKIKSLSTEITDFINQQKDKKEIISIFEIWQSVFSPESNIRTEILKDYIKIISERATHYISKMFGEQLVFELVFNDSDNSLYDNFIRNGFSFNFFSLSQGEKKRIELGVLLAFYEIMSLAENSKLNILILDEPFDGIADDQINFVMNVVYEFVHKYNIQTFFITHNVVLDDSLFDYTFNFVNNDGITIIS